MNTTPFELREWRLADVNSLARHANNARVWDNLRDSFPRPYTRADARLFIETGLCTIGAPTDLAIVVDGKAVGCISIVPRGDVERVTAELGYWLGENFWNKGIMTAATRQMVAHAFTRFRHLRKIYALVFDFNAPSRRVLENAGFEREAILEQAAIKNGKIIDFHYYSILRSQWETDAPATESRPEICPPRPSRPLSSPPPR
ncbi:MAG: GNAT family N-acetyltransferase [Odoribacteraceae bacterium]|jgi:RimJ/RimL family protein N-acetyltransferase|nr:GNAT family N-acetyltransferase [Odoribacteraceae bacterium]